MLASPYISDYICAGIGQQGYQRNQNCDIHQQGKVTGQRCLPCQLSDACESTQRLNRDGSSNGKTDRDARKREQLRPDNGNNMPEEDAQLA
jgi:hypothetical protein